MSPKWYRKKPVVIEAELVKLDNVERVAEWCGGRAEQPSPSGTVYAPGIIAIEALEGTMWAQVGDYVIKGVKGEFSPCKPEIFVATYELVEGE